MKIYQGQNHWLLSCIPPISIVQYSFLLNRSLQTLFNPYEPPISLKKINKFFGFVLVSSLFHAQCAHDQLISNGMLRYRSILFRMPDPCVHLCRKLWKTNPGSLMMEWVWSVMCLQPMAVDSLTPPYAEHWMVCSDCACILEEDRVVRWWSRPPAALLAFIFSVCQGCIRKATLETEPMSF